MKLRSTTHGIAREEGTPSSDAFGVRTWGETVMAVLADGAGMGEPAREAAQRAVRSLLENYEARPRTWSPQRALTEFTQLLNRTLYQESLARFDRPEMVSTLAATVIEGDRLYGVNIGDSRVCLARNGTLEVLSEDHVEADRTHVLTRALGMAPDVEPHVFERTLQNGDITLLCSDGVSNHLSTDELAGELAASGTARGIVKAAHKCASEETMDDMSAIVLDVAQTGRLRAMSERDLSIPASLRKGEVIDGYELVRSFQDSDRVWLAEKNGQRVVLKFAPLEAADSEAHLNAFVRETWNATRLDSENIISAHEPAGQTARYYVMEFVDAPSLSKVLQDRRLSVDSAIGLGRFLGEAGSTLLRRDLVHGDIKPENILCVGDYAKLSFKLLDLGSAAEVFSVTSRAGTASYLAPERFHGAPISERTEIFAMGVTLYQSLTQAFPFGRIERFQTPAFHAAKRPTKLNPNIPPWLEAVILRAVARNPQRRYQHYSEFIYDLAHPEKVEPFFEDDAPLLERNPLGFYKAGFYILLLLTLWLLMQLLTRP
ncbi:serine/threonine protein phosphatase PrpC [Roseimicrobium gellanilyticum]|uniref:Serine/threonine protein phosphatase PrpC n=1 Tax=Roseimicrobium gellanilyticum TaxID=748857 RepID=A0A366HVC0_9BACT|nr:bifunctional protein-serine/threonine kinase/phosphatase [Roseimicrobium gellanilyticum]RBP47639.1 serine/threonine protein phosphatase PrpC [Roseimicrobium gellanilyticum]